ncbi:MAG: ribonuclease H-like domain-containing protein [Thermoplasmata archaeon]|nr:ribonuclease H-like domain-containing protein [Thermoplasmata archaeon]
MGPHRYTLGRTERYSTMLRSTFVHLQGIGLATEAALWSRGILDWSDLRGSAGSGLVHAPRQASLDRELIASELALSERRGVWFAHRLPSAETWRLYPTFHRETAFLDIETTSLSPYEGIVTTVSVHGGGATRTFVAEEDLEELPAYLARFQLLVTFNGIRFDVPFLLVRFPDLIVPPGHIDLRFLLYRIGYAGGLKRIEQTLGLGDRAGVEGIHGLDAVRLWEQHRQGRSGALERLIRYNRADTVNLEPLLDFAVTELARRLLPTPLRPEPGGPGGNRSESAAGGARGVGPPLSQ